MAMAGTAVCDDVAPARAAPDQCPLASGGSETPTAPTLADPAAGSLAAPTPDTPPTHGTGAAAAFADPKSGSKCCCCCCCMRPSWCCSCCCCCCCSCCTCFWASQAECWPCHAARCAGGGAPVRAGWPPHRTLRRRCSAGSASRIFRSGPSRPLSPKELPLLPSASARPEAADAVPGVAVFPAYGTHTVE